MFRMALSRRLSRRVHGGRTGCRCRDASACNHVLGSVAWTVRGARSRSARRGSTPDQPTAPTVRLLKRRFPTYGGRFVKRHRIWHCEGGGGGGVATQRRRLTPSESTSGRFGTLPRHLHPTTQDCEFGIGRAGSMNRSVDDTIAARRYAYIGKQAPRPSWRNRLLVEILLDIFVQSLGGHRMSQ